MATGILRAPGLSLFQGALLCKCHRAWQAFLTHPGLLKGRDHLIHPTHCRVRAMCRVGPQERGLVALTSLQPRYRQANRKVNIHIEMLTG